MRTLGTTITGYRGGIMHILSLYLATTAISIYCVYVVSLHIESTDSMIDAGHIRIVFSLHPG